MTDIIIAIFFIIENIENKSENDTHNLIVVKIAKKLLLLQKKYIPYTLRNKENFDLDKYLDGLNDFIHSCSKNIDYKSKYAEDVKKKCLKF